MGSTDICVYHGPAEVYHTTPDCSTLIYSHDVEEVEVDDVDGLDQCDICSNGGSSRITQLEEMDPEEVFGETPDGVDSDFAPRKSPGGAQ